MAYATYEFYTNTYFGSTVPEDSFNMWQSRATDRLDYLTFKSIDENALTDYATEISKAACCLMDMMYKFQKAEDNATSSDSGNIKSMSSGGESVSFGTNDTVYTANLADPASQMQQERSAIAEYLADTGLMYAGAY